MDENEVRVLVRKMIIERFEESIKEPLVEHIESQLPVVSENELRYLVRSRLRESVIKTKKS